MAHLRSDRLFAHFFGHLCNACHLLPSEMPSFVRAILAYVPRALCISLRPHGWLFVPVALFFWLFLTQAPTTTLNTISVLVLPLLFVPLLPGLGQSVSVEGHAAMPAQGIMIWGYDAARSPMPSDHISVSSNFLTTFAVIYVATPLFLFALCCAPRCHRASPCSPFLFRFSQSMHTHLPNPHLCSQGDGFT